VQSATNTDDSGTDYSDALIQKKMILCNIPSCYGVGQRNSTGLHLHDAIRRRLNSNATKYRL